MASNGVRGAASMMLAVREDLLPSVILIRNAITAIAMGISQETVDQDVDQDLDLTNATEDGTQDPDPLLQEMIGDAITEMIEKDLQVVIAIVVEALTDVTALIVEIAMIVEDILDQDHQEKIEDVMFANVTAQIIGERMKKDPEVEAKKRTGGEREEILQGEEVLITPKMIGSSQAPEDTVSIQSKLKSAF